MCQLKYVPFDVDFVCSGQSGSLLGSSGWLVLPPYSKLKSFRTWFVIPRSHLLGGNFPHIPLLNILSDEVIAHKIWCLSGFLYSASKVRSRVPFLRSPFMEEFAWVCSCCCRRVFFLPRTAWCVFFVGSASRCFFFYLALLCSLLYINIMRLLSAWSTYTVKHHEQSFWSKHAATYWWFRFYHWTTTDRYL
jgi:hypothetical protein